MKEWKKVIVFEAFPKGHRLHFAGVVTKALSDLGASPVLWLPQYIKGTEQEQVFLAETHKDLNVEYFEMPQHEDNNYRLASQKIVEIIRNEDPFRLFLPTADGIAQTMGLRSLMIPAKYRKKIEAIVFRGPFAYPATGVVSRFKNLVIRQLVHAAGFGATHRVDPIAHFAISPSKRTKYGERLLPEPLDDQFKQVSQAQAREKLGLDLNDRYIVALGQMNQRKGIDVLIRAFAAAKIPKDIKLVLAGLQSAEISSQLQNEALVESGQIIVRNCVVPQNEFDLMLCASNWLAVTYPRHLGSSGILLRANQFRRPVIASDFGWVGWATETFGLGLTCDAKSVAGVVSAIEKSANDNIVFEDSPANRCLARYHTEDNFERHLLREYCIAHNCFDADGLIDWRSVEDNLADESRP